MAPAVSPSEYLRVNPVRVNVVCRNLNDDRIIPRMARALRDQLGWTLTAAPVSGAEAYYLSGYFEGPRLNPWPDVPVAAYFTHREEEPKGNAKAKLFDAMAAKVDLRIATCRLYAEPLSVYGPTVQAAAPLERGRFVPAKKNGPCGLGQGKPVVGLSGYTYANRRKGEDLVLGMLQSAIGAKVDWRASGRGWPVTTKRYTWAEMPTFYQGLDVLVVPSRVEGIPMPALEALACGVRVVIPTGVGLLDELAEAPGLHRYERGDLASLLVALERALSEEGDPEALRAVTEPYGLEAWVEDNARAMGALLGGALQLDAGFSGEPATVAIAEEAVEEIPEQAPVDHGTAGRRGIYCVAFGDPARKAALRMMTSAKRQMPDIPIALCAASKIGPEDLLLVEPDSDIGGRRAKLRAYELTPAEWQAVLYLDADTEVVAPIYRYFEWIEDGWEFVICQDPPPMDTLFSFARKNKGDELDETWRAVKTWDTLQYNGGVWAFCRNERVAAFFRRWRQEWERHAQRDQGALIRAMYADPLKVYLLGNEWNTFPKYTQGITTAGLMHYPGDARRWKGLIAGRIDSKEAWTAVRQFEAMYIEAMYRGQQMS